MRPGWGLPCPTRRMASKPRALSAVGSRAPAPRAPPPPRPPPDRLGGPRRARLVDEVARAVDVLRHPEVAGPAGLRVRTVIGGHEQREGGLLGGELVLLLLVLVEGVGAEPRALARLADEGGGLGGVEHERPPGKPIVAREAEC